jgi:hypothetical protein
MSKIESALGHHLDRITIAKLETEVPTEAQDDDPAVEEPPANKSSMLLNLPKVCPQLLKDHSTRLNGEVASEPAHL